MAALEDVNTKWIDNLTKQIRALPDCKSLDKLIAWLREKFQELIEDILNQIAKLVGLIIPPTSLSKIIKYLKNLVAQYLGPYLAAIRQLASIIRAFARLLQAIQQKLQDLHCSISPARLINQLKTDLTSAAYRRLYDGPSTLAQLTDIAQRLRGGVPPLQIIADRFGVNINGLPTVAMQYGGTLPFMQKMLDTYQPVTVPDVPKIPAIVTPDELLLDKPAPTLDSLSTSFGAKAGGTPLTITGTGFLEGITVMIGETECTGVTLIDDTSVQCTTPPLATGFPYSVTVTNSDGQSATLDNAFNVTD